MRLGLGALFTGIMAAALLALPRPALAHEAFCWEIFNPHGQTTPPAGWSTAPGTENRATPVNPDGFYQVGACSTDELIDCPTGLGGPEFAGLCSCIAPAQPEAVLLYDAGDNCEADPEDWFQYSVNGDVTFDFGTVIKYTEANGKPQGIAPMAANNSQGGQSATCEPPADGPAVCVEYKLWGQGDLLVVSATDPQFQVCCHVPPPPSTCDPSGGGSGCPEFFDDILGD
jgi:hypothetical protein